MTAPPREPQSIYDALSTIYDWLCDDRLTQWPYMENGPFYSDLPKYQEVARVALAAAPAPSAEPPAQAATERMGTHWETCATDGGPRHYDCALRLIEQQAREIAELRNANSSFASRAICHGSRADGLLTCPKAPCDLCLHWQHERAERAEERARELEAQIANKS